MTLAPQQGHAVLKEKDLGHTLHVLRLELYNKWTRQKERMKQMEERQKAQHARLVDITKRCETTSLILYSQGQDFTFDMAYACQEATSLYQEFKKSTIPFDQIKQNIEFEITNYDSLIYSLKQIPPVILDEDADGEQADVDSKKGEKGTTDEKSTFQLDAQGIQDRAMCIEYAETLRKNMITILKRLEKDNKYYTDLYHRVERLNDFAQKKYTDLQQSIFINPGTSYPQILAGIPRQWERMKDDFSTKYTPLKERRNGQFQEYKSEWRGGIVMFASIFMLVYILGGAILSNVILRWLVPKRFRTERFKQKRGTLITALAVLIFAIAVMIVRTLFHHNLMLMATSLMIEMAWLIAAIYISLIILFPNHLDSQHFGQHHLPSNPAYLHHLASHHAEEELEGHSHQRCHLLLHFALCDACIMCAVLDRFHPHGCPDYRLVDIPVGCHRLHHLLLRPHGDV